MWIPLSRGSPLEERQVWTGLQHRSLDHPVGNDSPQLLRSRSVFRFLFILDRRPCLCHHQQGAAVIWLSVFAILFFVVFALSVSVSLSTLLLCVVFLCVLA